MTEKNDCDCEECVGCEDEDFSEQIENIGPGFGDFFFVEGLDVNQEDIKNIILPKFLMNKLRPGKIGEKGLLLLTLNGNHKNGVYAEAMKILKKGISELKIHFYMPPDIEEINEDEESAEIISTWAFTDLTVQAIDFGHAAAVRTDPPEVSMEFDYASFAIDGDQI